MHELALTRGVVETVVEEATKAGATQVKTVYLTIGYARDIVDDLLEGAFEFLSRDTIAHGAEIVINRIPLMVQCQDCKLTYHLNVHDQRTWACPRCSAKNYVIVSGREFYISKIEVA